MTGSMTYHQEQDIVLVKRAMLAAAARSVLLMDSSKMPRKALNRMAPLSGYDRLVVDDGADPEILAAVQEVVPTSVAAVES